MFRYPTTALSTASLFDIAATSPARRSLIFVDACRERVRNDARAGVPEPLSIAPLIREMDRVEGQAVFYAAAAGKYAYDDEKRKNGVFTAAVLEGLQRCRAHKDSRGLITFDTLSSYVESEVRTWIRMHRDPGVGSATQIAIDGATRSMPLALCSRRAAVATSAVPHPSRVTFDGASVTAYDRRGSRLWQRDTGDRVTRAEVADLDGDGASEVIALSRNALAVFDSSGNQRWTRTGVRSFITGDLQRRKTRQIVVVFTESISLLDAKGTSLATYPHPGTLGHVLVAARTARHDPKIIAAGTNSDLRGVATVFMIDPKRGTQLWYGALAPGLTIDALSIVDRDNDGRHDLAISTAKNGTIYLDFDGRIMSSGRGIARFSLIARK